MEDNGNANVLAVISQYIAFETKYYKHSVIVLIPYGFVCHWKKIEVRIIFLYLINTQPQIRIHVTCHCPVNTYCLCDEIQRYVRETVIIQATCH